MEELYEEDVRLFLRAEYAKAATNGFENIELLNDCMNGIPIAPKQFYKLCFRLAKEEILAPYVIQTLVERDSMIIILIQFIHNFIAKIETTVSYHSN